MNEQESPKYINCDDKRELEKILYGCPLCGKKPYHIVTITKIINRELGTTELVGYEIRCYDCKVNVGVFPTAEQARNRWNSLRAQKEMEEKTQ